MTWQKTLEQLVQIPELHGKFLNSLSLMEYIGARKIVKSQTEAQINSEMLSHAVEEFRHAQRIKKMALKLSQGQLSTYEPQYLLAGDLCRSYMQIVDRGVESLIGEGQPWANYLLTTLIIEERAGLIYPVYAELLRPMGLHGAIISILKEEEHHLQEVRDQLQKILKPRNVRVSLVRELECRAFLEIFAEIEKEIHLFKNSDSAIRL